MDGNARGFADSHQTRHHCVGIFVLRLHDFAVVVTRNAPHVVVNGGQYRDGLFRYIDAREYAGRLGDTGKPLVDHAGPEMLEMQIDVIVLGTYATTFADLHGHRAAHDVARGEVLRVRGITLHEALTLPIRQITTLAARAFGNQTAGAVDTRRVELHELHVLQREPGAQRHGVTVSGA